MNIIEQKPTERTLLLHAIGWGIVSVGLGVLFLLLMLSATGCAYLRSTTTKATDAKTGNVLERTTVRSYTLFDSQAALVKFRNTTGSHSNDWGSGTFIGSLQQESATTTNFNDLVGVIIGAAVKAAIKP